jgi:hypothetical protein
MFSPAHHDEFTKVCTELDRIGTPLAISIAIKEGILQLNACSQQCLSPMVTPFPEAVQHALKDQQDKTWSTQWGKSLIVIIWGYSAALWKHRNAHIYGVDDADAKRNTNLQLQARVQEACTAYEVDRFYVSPQHLSLIQSRSIMEERL